MLKINIDHSGNAAVGEIVMQGNCEQLTTELAGITISILKNLYAPMSSAHKKQFVEAFITEVYTNLLKDKS
ncbi:hypothetical protein [Ruminococcus sp. Marseille-P6503]|uniref:hypothetical protein n=1 Tax=Ruminococcus sp. Marseille-P6503 TaxID=2364796 RepID=UPI000F54AB31|nr:hypothetical protein [Ruminococcus sp. Marseille-P6503]